MRRTALTWCGLLLLNLGAVSAGQPAQKTPAGDEAAAGRLPERIWRNPGPAASLDMIHGAGGKAHAPDLDGTFAFVKEDESGSSPKFVVVDGKGVEWKVKLGQESQSETAATRFLWAAGYFTDEDYFVAALTVKGLPELRRGQEFVKPGGVVLGARLERRQASIKKLGGWDWFDNPFLGQRELNGLRVMMALLNNWDLKADNNAIYVVNGERHYAVSDAGATFGMTGNAMQRTRSVPADYRDSPFIAKETPDLVDFVLRSRPFFVVGAFAESNYRERTRMEQITRDIPRAHARWLGGRLSSLTHEQIRDGFRAADYGAADIESLARAISLRIAALKGL